jgi:hypothetical protein
LRSTSTVACGWKRIKAEELNELLLECVQIGTEFACGACLDDLALRNDADLAAETSDFLRVVSFELFDVESVTT